MPGFLHMRPGSRAGAKRSLAAAETAPAEVDAVLISNLHRVFVSGPDELHQRAAGGLRPAMLALDLVGQSCGAAMPNLQTARSLVAAGHCERMLSICVEVCSAAFYLDDDAGVLISAWILHPGGREVLQAMREKISLSGNGVRWSVGGGANTRNMSNLSVLFVLQAALADRASGGWWWKTSLGAGFSCHGTLLEVE
jgi:predicted naringenin-chalcone synthase